MEMSQPEAAAYKAAVPEKLLDLIGRSICSYIKVLGGSPQEKVADTSAHKVGNKAASMEAVKRT
jgi:hypothetical protein